MIKKKNDFRYHCISCGHLYQKWFGKCLECSQWNTIELKESRRDVLLNKNYYSSIEVLALKDKEEIKLASECLKRLFDGHLKKSLKVLTYGAPGVGKTTFALTVASDILKLNQSLKVLYVTTEESYEKMASKIKRLNIKEENFYITSTSILSEIKNHLEIIKPDFLVIDSIHNLDVENVDSFSSCSHQMERIVDYLNFDHSMITFFVGHVTKSGSHRGSKNFEHFVDLIININTDSSNKRLLKVVKNRFGESQSCLESTLSFDGFINIV